MTDIHSCSYYCDRPSCIKAQRDEMRLELARLRAVEEMDAVAIKYAHKLALDLECIIGSDYGGTWYDSAMQTISGYRMEMNAIHERESPTHMGEPLIVPPAQPAKQGWREREERKAKIRAQVMRRPLRAPRLGEDE